MLWACWDDLGLNLIFLPWRVRALLCHSSSLDSRMKLLLPLNLPSLVCVLPLLPQNTIPFPCSEIDKTLESMSSYRKNKWIVEGRLRR